MTERIVSARLDLETVSRNFDDIHPPLSAAQAKIEAERCLRCYDAPCIEACPTQINIPSFINRIATGDLRGSARTILDSNILGGSCARVCPTEILCEGACVRVAQGEKAVEIGALQRHAVDWQMPHGQPFSRAPETGRRIAVIGAGPAGLACAHRLAMLGHDIQIYEAAGRAGGLNEYGIAAYKLVDQFARQEIDFLLGIGGISIETGRALGRDLTLETLRGEFDAVFLAMGQSGIRALSLPGEDLAGIRNAVDFIADLRQADDLTSLPVGRHVVVIGGGNTAVDAAVQCRRLGAEEVTLAYRRGAATMSATVDEQEWAKSNGVMVRHWIKPLAFHGDTSGVTEAVFASGAPNAEGNNAYETENLTIRADMVLKAVGQFYADGPESIAIEAGRIQVDDAGRTSLPGVYAGGDCVAGLDLTVAAVAMGRDAAITIDRDFKESRHG